MSVMEEKYIGLALAISSSILIATSFIITKKGLNESVENNGDIAVRPSENYSYLKNYTWWIGMIVMSVGEISNFAAYSFAPAILVTPLGALSVLIGAILASVLLKEKLGNNGNAGCGLCLIGTILIILHTPDEPRSTSIDQILGYCLSPGFICYLMFVVIFCMVMIYKVVPTYGDKNPLVYISICSFVGSITVVSCKGFGIAIKLTFAGLNQFSHLPTYLFLITVVVCIIIQMNFFNRALDCFNTSIVNPIYYVFFTTATISASAILFKGFYNANTVDTISLFCGFFTIFIGVFLLNDSRDDGGGGRYHIQPANPANG